MKIIYAGSPVFAVKPLERLLECGADVAAVITRPDKPAGRKKIILPTPVKAFAIGRGIPVFDFSDVRKNLGAIGAVGADLMITCAYGQILSPAVLDLFPKGVWNLHASLLPKFRGASPVQAAILAGERFTGVTVMKTEPALDSGDILLVKRCRISGKTCGELTEELSLVAADCAQEALRRIEKGDTELLLQDESAASYCKKIKKDDCRINFCAPAAEIVRAVKAFSPEPAAYCWLNEKLLNILNAEECDGERYGKPGEVLYADKRGITVSCFEGNFRITRLQLAGGRVMSAAEFMNGRKLKVGDILD